MTFYVFKNYGFVNESCYIETPSEVDAIENFKFAYELAEPGDIVELAYFASSGEFICLDRVEIE